MSKRFNIHILLYREDHIQIAHCLEFDILAQGETKQEALRNLLDAIELQMDFALENDCVETLYNPAPVEYWRMLIKARKYSCKLKRRMPAFISYFDCHSVRG